MSGTNFRIIFSLKKWITTVVYLGITTVVYLGHAISFWTNLYRIQDILSRALDILGRMHDMICHANNMISIYTPVNIKLRLKMEVIYRYFLFDPALTVVWCINTVYQFEKYWMMTNVIQLQIVFQSRWNPLCNLFI